MENLTISQIREKYPDQWVLLGDPELSNPEINGSIISKLIRGMVLYASKDKRELAYKAVEYKGQVNKTACIYTGKISNNSLFLL